MYTHTYILTYIHTYTHACARPYVHIRTCVYTVCIHTYTYKVACLCAKVIQDPCVHLRSVLLLLVLLLLLILLLLLLLSSSSAFSSCCCCYCYCYCYCYSSLLLLILLLLLLLRQATSPEPSTFSLRLAGSSKSSATTAFSPQHFKPNVDIQTDSHIFGWFTTCTVQPYSWRQWSSAN